MSRENYCKKLTPAMQQVKKFKSEYPDCILFIRIGDFYETFFEDAEICAKELDIVLTSHSKDADGNPIPLAGVPYHAVDTYLPRMIRRGYKVAICEQMEDPKLAKGVVKRDVIKVVTPGTAIDADIIPGGAAHYLMSLCTDSDSNSKLKLFGLAFIDITTGEFFVKEAEFDKNYQSLATEIERYNPLEILVSKGISAKLIKYLASTCRVITPIKESLFANGKDVLCRQFHVESLDGFDTSSELCINAAGAALSYIKDTQKTDIPYIKSFSKRYDSGRMVLDAVTLKNLEILSPLHGDRNDTTLFGFLKRTKTPMGARALRNAVMRPLALPDEINARLNAVGFLKDKPVLLSELRSTLAHFTDIERIAGRISYGNASPKDLLSLSSSLSEIPNLLSELENSSGLIKEELDKIPDFSKTAELIKSAINDDPSLVYKNGGVIRDGYSKELDSFRDTETNGREWIAALQNKERERTGIKSLKISYNNVFGYYIEVTKSGINKVPPEYERKQTLANGERFTIPVLRDIESKMVQASENILALEIKLYEELIESLRKDVSYLQESAIAIGVIDMLASFADIALTNNYVRPEIHEGTEILIRDGRHPIVENMISGGYVPNDLEMSAYDKQIMILTGANMSGKSTYMRCAALICIMAQMGSFVPASFAKIGIVDRIFTRVGASDDLAGGQSTFMVEMLELANILNNATDRSLILLDEIGRGTSTVDGYSIARAVLEYIHGKGGKGPRTLFATHFHQLISMEGEMKRIRNFHFAVKENKQEITFLRKLIPGATDRSYGIHVAKIAGVPKKVLVRADEILKSTLKCDTGSGQKYYTQMLLVDTPEAEDKESKVEERLREVNPNDITPMQALMLISELKGIMEDKN